jgi:DNA-binding HxlR family transcriptional regulator
LTQQLRELIADGLVTRRRTGAVPSPVIYSLTDYGNTALPMLEQVRRWGERHIERSGSRSAPSCHSALEEART